MGGRQRNLSLLMVIFHIDDWTCAINGARQDVVKDGNGEVIRARLPLELVERIDAWRAQEPSHPSRNEAVKLLLIAHFWPNLPRSPAS